MVNTESKDPTKTEFKKEKVHAIDYIKLIEEAALRDFVTDFDIIAPININNNSLVIRVRG
jgi:hypothetical protein